MQKGINFTYNGQKLFKTLLKEINLLLTKAKNFNKQSKIYKKNKENTLKVKRF